LGGIEEHQGVVPVGDVGQFGHGLNAPGDIGGVVEDDESGGALLECLAEPCGGNESGFGIKAEKLDVDIPGLLEEAERSEDGIVIQFGGDDTIAGLEQSEDDGIEAGGAARGKHDGIRAGCSEEFGEGGAGLEKE
jgi:hypothetical protein